MSTKVNVDLQLTPERQDAIDVALTKRQEADYQCYMLLRRVRPYIGVEPVDDDGTLTDLLEDVEEQLNRRDEANREFMKAFTGR